jgi:hypothetical protein
VTTRTVPIIEYLKRRIPRYKALGKERLWRELEERIEQGEIQGLVPVSGQVHDGQKIKLGPTKPERRFFGFVQVAVVAGSAHRDTTTARPPEAVPKPATRLPLPKYATPGVSRDEFFLAHLDLEARAHYKAIEPQYRAHENGSHLLAEALQHFVDQCIADHRGKPPPVVRTSADAAESAVKPKFVGYSRSGKVIVECPACHAQMGESRVEAHLLDKHGSRQKVVGTGRKRKKRRKSGRKGTGKLRFVQGGAPGLGRR